MVFPVVMCGCESWTIKKAECQRIDAFELWGWRRFFSVLSLDCKEIQSVHPKGNQSWIFIGRSDADAETPIIWPPDAELTHWKRLWCWERLRAGGEGDDRGWDGWMASQLNGHEFEWTPGVGDGQGGLVCCNSWDRRVRHDWATELNWTDTQVG